MRTSGLAFRYAVAILAAAFALYLRYLLTPLLGKGTTVTATLPLAESGRSGNSSSDDGHESHSPLPGRSADLATTIVPEKNSREGHRGFTVFEKVSFTRKILQYLCFWETVSVRETAI
jgi:hypothetical protein